MDFAFRLLFSFHRLQTIFNKIKAKLSVAVGSINNAIKTESKARELNVVCEHQQEQFLEISINGNVEAFNTGFKKIWRNFNLKVLLFYLKNFYYYKFKARCLKDTLRRISPIELKC